MARLHVLFVFIAWFLVLVINDQTLALGAGQPFRNRQRLSILKYHEQCDSHESGPILNVTLPHFFLREGPCFTDIT